MKYLHKKFQIFIITLIVGVFNPVHADSKSDLAKEKRWESQIVDSLLVGEAIKLKVGDTRFLALYSAPETSEVKGAVIIIHGIGVHPAWPDVIDPLRMQLPELGWHTLSIQMPILANDAKDTDYVPLFPEVPARIQAGVDFLKAKGIKYIALTGHSLGATMASYYLAKNKDPLVKSFAIISGGMGVPDKDGANILSNLKKIKNVHLVEIFGSEDHPRVIENLKKRKSYMRKAQYKKYSTLRISGANHFYRDRQKELVNKFSIKLNKLRNLD